MKVEEFIERLKLEFCESCPNNEEIRSSSVCFSSQMILTKEEKLGCVACGSFIDNSLPIFIQFLKEYNPRELNSLRESITKELEKF